MRLPGGVVAALLDPRLISGNPSGCAPHEGSAPSTRLRITRHMSVPFLQLLSSMSFLGAVRALRGVSSDLHAGANSQPGGLPDISRGLSGSALLSSQFSLKRKALKNSDEFSAEGC